MLAVYYGTIYNSRFKILKLVSFKEFKTIIVVDKIIYSIYEYDKSIKILVFYYNFRNLNLIILHVVLF